jgi:hypothetical protein
MQFSMRYPRYIFKYLLQCKQTLSEPPFHILQHQGHETIVATCKPIPLPSVFQFSFWPMCTKTFYISICEWHSIEDFLKNQYWETSSHECIWDRESHLSMGIVNNLDLVQPVNTYAHLFESVDTWPTSCINQGKSFGRWEFISKQEYQKAPN